MSNYKIIKKINELYVLKRSKFLIMKKNGEYCTIQQKDKTDKRNQIMDWRVESHLDNMATLGVFSGSEFTKFICFDVDVADKELAKWTVYKLIDTLNQAGISNDYIYTSFSGSKGYHVEIFFNEPIHNSYANKFYLIILNNAELLNVDFGQVEFRPTEGQGVKIPLGTHFKTGNKCWYCDYANQLNQIEDMQFILSIKQLDRQYFYDLLNIDESNITEKQALGFENNIKSKYKPLAIYKENIDEDVTIESIQELIVTGLTMTGTRHNSLLKIAKYCKYSGFNNKDAELFLIDWMKLQDIKCYTTEWKDVIIDIKSICDNKYYDNYTLTIKRVNIEITKQELEEILSIDGKNEQLLIYCMLIHKKRYATKDGLFYMTYDQLSEVSGLSRRTAIRLIKKLEELELLDIARDINKPTYNIASNTIKSKPNIYKINLLSDKLTTSNDIENVFNVCDKNCSGCYNACLCQMFTNEDLKVILPRRQYEKVINFRNYCSA